MLRTETGVRAIDTDLAVTGPVVAGWGVAALLVVAAFMLSGVSGPAAWACAVAAVGSVVAGSAVAGRRTAARVRSRLLEATAPPSLVQVARAVADGLHAAGLVRRGADAVELDVTGAGEYRPLLGGVDETESSLFATALDEMVSPIAGPRYVVSRYVSDPPQGPSWMAPSHAAVDRSLSSFRPTGEVWHAVPTTLGANAKRAQAFAGAWETWVGGGRLLHTGSPEGAGVLTAQAGSDPFDVSTVMRRQWE